MNWGYRILVVYLLFVGGILFMVFKSTQQRSDLVSENYYEKEIQYQQVIDAGKNTAPFSKEIRLRSQQDSVILQLPVSVGASVSNGTIEFLCMNDKKQDVKLPLKTGADGVQYIGGNLLRKGNYQVQISWTDKNIPYYFEQSFFVN